MSEALAPFVSLAGVLVLFVAIGWMISPAFRGWLKFKLGRALFVVALAVVAIGFLAYDW
ncbi:MAG: hypothetical protein ACRDT8_03250 [Micromonosporaceae bacterium]